MSDEAKLFSMQNLTLWMRHGGICIMATVAAGLLAFLVEVLVVYQDWQFLRPLLWPTKAITIAAFLSAIIGVPLAIASAYLPIGGPPKENSDCD